MATTISHISLRTLLLFSGRWFTVDRDSITTVLWLWVRIRNVRPGDSRERGVLTFRGANSTKEKIRGRRRVWKQHAPHGWWVGATYTSGIQLRCNRHLSRTRVCDIYNMTPTPTAGFESRGSLWMRNVSHYCSHNTRVRADSAPYYRCRRRYHFIQLSAVRVSYEMIYRRRRCRRGNGLTGVCRIPRAAAPPCVFTCRPIFLEETIPHTHTHPFWKHTFVRRAQSKSKGQRFFR